MDTSHDLPAHVSPSSPLLGPAPLAHSQELEARLPRIRRHVGPRAWYQCLEAWQIPQNRDSSSGK